VVFFVLREIGQELGTFTDRNETHSKCLKGEKNMQIKLTTDYAIRCVLYLATHPGNANAEDIGKQTGITTNYVRRILHDLKKKGIVRSYQGLTGGYVLARNPEDIRIIDIIEAGEKSIHLNRFMEDNAPSFWISEEEKGNMSRYLDRLQMMVETYLRSETIDEILHTKAE